MSVERTVAGLQLVIPGCEWRSLPRSPTRSDRDGQGLLDFYSPPSLREEITSRANAPLQAVRGQRPPPGNGLFGAPRVKGRRSPAPDRATD
jgi:hypothetical protein